MTSQEGVEPAAKVMKEEKSADLELEQALEGASQPSGVIQPQRMTERPGWRVWREGKREPSRGMQQRWETQWQEFLKALQAPHSAWGKPPLSEAAPWDDAKAFLAAFEQVAEACRWPRKEWAARLLPALSGEAKQAFSLLGDGDKEDYGKVKAAILRGDALRREKQRQHFRQFCCPEVEDPRKMYVQLQELCCQWLKPEKHTKEQILELLVLEQFLASLPVDVQSWIRAGGPDSCAQAVALLEELLASQREAEMQQWQEPLQALGPLDVKEEPWDMVQGEISQGHAKIFGGIQQNVLPGTGIARPTSSLPPGGQDVTGAEMTKALGVQVNQVGECMAGAERGGSLCQEGSSLDNAPHPVEKEETFILDLVECLPGQGSDDGKRIQLKVKNSQYGGNEPVKRPRAGRQETQEKVPVTAEIQEERGEAKSRQRTEPLEGCEESAELTEGLGAACSNPSPMDKGEKKATFSKYGRRYRPQLGLVSEHTGQVCNEGPLLGEKMQPKSDLDEPHSRPMEEEENDCPEFGVHSNSLANHQIIRAREKAYKCPDCGEGFFWKSNLRNHLSIHTGAKPHQCSDCGKGFSRKATLLIHQMIHTGQKPHQCPECGRGFSWKSNLRRHQRIHTGKKPHKRSGGGNKSSQKSDLSAHQKSRSGKKRHPCPVCGKQFRQSSKLLTHQSVHTGEKPHKCPECGKSFSRRATMLVHQAAHTGEKQHQCPECGRRFVWKSNLRRHRRIHTGKKPHKSPNSGKTVSS